MHPGTLARVEPAISVACSCPGVEPITSHTAADRDDLSLGPFALAEPRPRIHDLASLLEQIAAAVRGLDLVADRVRQRHLGDLVREVRALCGPIAEARPEPVRGELTPLHPLQ